MDETEAKLWKPELHGYSNDILPYYREIITKIPEHSKLVEVGVFFGRSALFMVDEMDRLHKDVYFYGVDLGDLPPPLKNRNIHYLQMYSVEAAKSFQDESLDFVFIDATHSYEAVKEDIQAWLPKVKKGGIISGHDYHDYSSEGSYPGVRKAVDEAFPQDKIGHPTRTVWEVIKD